MFEEYETVRGGGADVRPHAGTLPGGTLDGSVTPLPGQSLSISPRLESLSRQEKRASNRRTAALVGIVNGGAANRLLDCNPGEYSCGVDKFCLFCGHRRATELKGRYRQRLSQIETAYHLTLTMRPTTALFRRDLQDLRGSFNRLKNSRPFERRVAGGIANYQVVHSADGWLPHIHSVLDCREALTESWMRSEWVRLGGGYEVRLQPIIPQTEDKVFAYGAQRQRLPDQPHLFLQLYQASYSFHPIQVWGSLHALHGKPFLNRAQGKKS